MFYAEHLHKDQEIRLITAGSGYFEIRDYDDKWIRLHLKKVTSSISRRAFTTG